MIEIQNVHPINKGSVLATCDVYIKPWHITLKEVAIFQKGMNRWVGMPSRKMEINGETKYMELIQFDSESAKKRFRDQICKYIDEYLEKNPEMKPEDIIKQTEDLPF